MTGDTSASRGSVITFGRFQLRIGAKTVIALLLIALIIWAGFAVAPDKEPWKGVIPALSAIAGTFLGVVLQVEPKPVDHRPTALAAVHSLASVADTVEVSRTLATQLAEQSKEQRTIIGLVAVQDELSRVGTDLHVGMLQWDTISEGVTEAVIAERQKGHELFRRLAERDSDV